MSEADPVASVRDGYDRWASVYDHDANPTIALEGPVMHAAFGELRGMHALDLGCGTGRHACALAAAGAKVTAVDFSPGMLAEAMQKSREFDVRFLVHDLHQPLPLRSASFDLVVSGLVLEHLRDLGAFFAEVQRLLRPGGRAVVSAMHPSMFLRGSQARFTDPETGDLVQPGSFNHSIGEIVMSILGAGLELQGLSEHAPDAAFVERFARAEKYLDWPMLIVLQMKSKS